MLELVYEEGGVTHRTPLRHGLALGRSSDNDVVLRDFSVSRHHARVEEEGGVFRVIDLDSTNGVKINESFVTCGALASGDQLTIGSFQLLVQDTAADSGGLSSATYLRPLAEFNQDYGLEGTSGSISKEVGLRERVFETLAQVAKTLIETHRDKLEVIANSLLEFESLDGQQVAEIIKTGKFSPPAPPPKVDPPTGAQAVTPLPEIPKPMPPKLPGLGNPAPATV